MVSTGKEAIMIHGAGIWKDDKPISLGWHLTAFNKKVFD